MICAILLYPRVTALDAIGPYEVLQRVPSIDVVFVGAERGTVRTENDPAPPFDAGRPDAVDDVVRTRVREWPRLRY